ncbi:MAG: hypothetical protein MR601_01590 [Erysipelotrichaceae bacterium]|nr:hypothetical protein [Erysipelotrichaceae bacterium]
MDVYEKEKLKNKDNAILLSYLAGFITALFISVRNLSTFLVFFGSKFDKFIWMLKTTLFAGIGGAILGFIFFYTAKFLTSLFYGINFKIKIALLIIISILLTYVFAIYYGIFLIK